MPYRIVDTLHLIGLRAASRGLGVWMFSIPGSGMQLFAVPLEMAAWRPRIAGIGSSRTLARRLLKTLVASMVGTDTKGIASAQYGDRFVRQRFVSKIVSKIAVLCCASSQPQPNVLNPLPSCHRSGVFLYLAGPPHPPNHYQPLELPPTNPPKSYTSYTSRRNPSPHRSTQAQNQAPGQRMDAPTGRGPWPITVAPT